MSMVGHDSTEKTKQQKLQSECLLLVSGSTCMMCVSANAELASEMPVDSGPTNRTAEIVTADDAEQLPSPIPHYRSYDERPLPAIRRFLLVACSLILLHWQHYCHFVVAWHLLL